MSVEVHLSRTSPTLSPGSLVGGEETRSREGGPPLGSLGEQEGAEPGEGPVRAPLCPGSPETHTAASVNFLAGLEAF